MTVKIGSRNQGFSSHFFFWGRCVFPIRRIGRVNTAERAPQYGGLTRSFRRIEKLTKTPSFSFAFLKE